MIPIPAPAMLVGVAFALGFYAVLWLFRHLAPAHAVAALDRARPSDWIAVGLFAAVFAFLVAL